MYNITHDLFVGRLGVDLKIYGTYVGESNDRSVRNFVYTCFINTRGYSISKVFINDEIKTKDVSESEAMLYREVELVTFDTFLYPSDPSDAEMKMLKMVHGNAWGKCDEIVTYLCSTLNVHWAGGHEEGTLQKLTYDHLKMIELA